MRGVMMGLVVLACVAARPVTAPSAPPIPIPAIDQWAPAVTHRLLPLSAGVTWAYVDSASGETDTTRVARETVEILGVRTTVVIDRTYRHGALIEDSRDYYAQDKSGNVWYLGEDTREIRSGKTVSAAGSWRAGRDDGQPGIVMWAAPSPGDPYREEYLAGHAEDMARVVSADTAVAGPSGRYRHCVAIEEWSRLEPGVRELKIYAPATGLVEQKTLAGGHEHLVLVSWTKPDYDGE
jgi:hypothetical protein